MPPSLRVATGLIHIQRLREAESWKVRTCSQRCLVNFRCYFSRPFLPWQETARSRLSTAWCHHFPSNRRLPYRHRLTSTPAGHIPTITCYIRGDCYDHEIITKTRGRPFLYRRGILWLDWGVHNLFANHIMFVFMNYDLQWVQVFFSLFYFQTLSPACFRTSVWPSFHQISSHAADTEFLINARPP